MHVIAEREKRAADAARAASEGASPGEIPLAGLHRRIAAKVKRQARGR